MKKLTLIFLLALLTQISFSKNEDYHLEVGTEHFIKNKEYFSDYAKGYTLLGSDVYAVYVINKGNRELNLGAQVRKYYGDEGTSLFEPFINMTLRDNENFFEIGTIKYNDETIPQYLFDYDNQKWNNFEYGFNGKFNKNKFILVWENFLEKEANEQEELYFNYSYEAIKNDNFSTNIGAFIYHKGGQIDTSEEDMQLEKNVFLNLDFAFDKFNIGNNYISSKAINKEYDKGFGNFSYIKSKNNKLTIGHWFADSYIASMADEIFQSILYDDTIPESSERKLITASYNYAKLIFGSVEFQFRTDAYWDYDNGSFDFSNGLYFKTKDIF